MSTCLPYIANISTNERVQEALTDIHDRIFTRLENSKLFRNYNGLPFLPVNQTRYIATKNLISRINSEYETTVVDTAFTKESGKEYMFVNVKFLAAQLIQAASSVQQRETDLGIDEFGDSVPMYKRTNQNRLQLESESLGREGISNILNRISDSLGVNHTIISSEEATELLKDTKYPYNGEPAFFYKGEVYLVEGKWNLDSKLHEIIHPFIRAIAKYNPELFNSLYKSATPEIQAVIAEVTESHPDLAEAALNGNVIPFMEEVLVRVIQNSAAEKILQQESKTWLQRFWTSLKGLFRKLFPATDLSNLNSNTTIEELSDILLSGNKIKIRDSHLSFVNPMFNRDFIPEMEKISDKDKFDNQIKLFYALLTSQLQTISKNKKLYDQLKSIVGKPEDGSPSPFFTAKGELKDAKQLLEIAGREKDKLLSFAEGISSVSTFLTQMLKHIDTLMEDKSVGEEYTIKAMRDASFIVNDWENMLEGVKKQLPVFDDGPLKGQINSILSTIKDINNKKHTWLTETGLTNLLVKDFEQNTFFQESLKKLRAEVEEQREKLKNGDKTILRKLRTNEALLEKIQPTPENITAWLSGQMGDSNGFSFFLESATSNPNLIVGGFANWYSKKRLSTENKISERVTRFSNKLQSIFDKATSFTRNEISKIFDVITDEETRGYVDNNNELKSEKIAVFANQYSGDYHYQVTKLNFDIQKEFDENGYSDKWAELKKLKSLFTSDYMFDEETDARVKARKFWEQSPLHLQVKKKRGDLYIVLNNLKKNLSKAVSDEEYESLKAEIILEERNLKNMGSTKDIYGNDKDDEGQLIAQIIKQYNDEFGGMYEQIEIRDSFNTQKELRIKQLLAQGIEEGSEEFNNKLNAWIRDNISVKLSEKFYEDRQNILGEIEKIIQKLPRDERDELDISKRWKDIFNLIQGFRDQDGQVIGNDLNLSQQDQIRKIEDEIFEIKSKFSKRNGLTVDENKELAKLTNIIDMGASLTDEDELAYNKLLAKMKKFGLSENDSVTLNKLYEILSEIQIRIPTSYYLDTINDKLGSVSGVSFRVDNENADYITSEEINPALNDADFKKWFLANHTLRNTFKKGIGPISIYQRSYSWSVVIPNDKDVMDSVTKGDYSNLIALNHPYVKITPTSQYFFSKLKEQYRTPKEVGVTIDNRGNWLPKPTSRSATEEQKKLMLQYDISFAKDDKFESKKYMDLLTNPSLKDYKDVLDTYKSFHIETQKEKAGYTKLWYDIPRRRKSNFEKLNMENVEKKVSELKGWWNTVNWFTKKETEDAFSRGEGNYDAASAVNYYVTTNLHGEQIAKIPIMFTQKIDVNELSQDLGNSLIQYGVSAEMNQMLHDINPIAEAFQDVLYTNKPQQVKVDKFGKIINAISKNLRKLNLPGIKVLSSTDESNMYKSFKNFYEREFLGIQKHYELGVGVDRFAGHLMKAGAVGALMLSPIASTKNYISGKIQITLEAITGKHFTGKDIIDGQTFFSTKVIPEISKDYYKLGNRGLYSQLFDLIDPLINYTDKVGERANISAKRDIATGKFLFSGQKMGEIAVQGSTAFIMMNHQMIDFTDPVTNEKSQIKMSDIYTLKDGVIQIKDGVDKEWDRDGDKFLQFKLRVQKVNERLQGAYAKENSAEIQRLTSGNLAIYMRKYFTPMFLNRFSHKRLQVAEGVVREGYYQTFYKTLRDMVEYRDVKNVWGNMKTEERANVMKTIAEMGYSMMFLMMISLLGFDSDDDDKYEKMKEMSWIQVYTIYQIMAIKSEAETFIPVFGMGLDEWMRNITTPSIAFNVMSKYKKLIQDFGFMMLGSDRAYYQQDYGVYDKGDAKFIADFYNLTGARNWLLVNDPMEGAKRYVMMSRRY